MEWGSKNIRPDLCPYPLCNVAEGEVIYGSQWFSFLTLIKH